jgi:hemerythrin-like metal-binding protein
MNDSRLEDLFRESGHSAINCDHRALEDLLRRIANTSSFDEAVVLFNDVFELWRHHAEHELRVMRDCGYPALHSHCRAHSEATRALLETGTRLRNRDVASVSRLAEWMAEWYDSHTEEHDKPLAEYLKAAALEKAG